MQSERPECQCLACAQLQHHQANDTLLLVAIGTVVVVGGLVWLVGQVAGLLASGAWPEVPLSQLPRSLVRLRDHASDPAAAWPANARDGLPGPLGMYATLAAILATPLALGALAWWLHQPPTPRGRQPPPLAQAGERCHLPHTKTCRCCRLPSPGRRRDRDHPPYAAGWAHPPGEEWRGRAGTAATNPAAALPALEPPCLTPCLSLAYPRGCPGSRRS